MYADKAYESKARQKRLWAQEIRDLIVHGPHKHRRELSYWQQRNHALIVPVQVTAGHVLGR